MDKPNRPNNFQEGASAFNRRLDRDGVTPDAYDLDISFDGWADADIAWAHGWNKAHAAHVADLAHAAHLADLATEDRAIVAEGRRAYHLQCQAVEAGNVVCRGERRRINKLDRLN